MILVQPSDFSELLKLKTDEEIDIAYRSACVISSMLNYLKVGDCICISGIKYFKNSDSSIEIVNNLDKKDLMEILSVYGEK